MSDSPHKNIDNGDKMDISKENHRFWFAVLLISGMLIIISIPIFQGKYDDGKNLAAVFSGWITAVVGFYFLQQNTEKAQQQAQQAIKDGESARRDSISASDKLAKISSLSTSKIHELETDTESLSKSLETLLERIKKEKKNHDKQGAERDE